MCVFHLTDLVVHEVWGVLGDGPHKEAGSVTVMAVGVQGHDVLLKGSANPPRVLPVVSPLAQVPHCSNPSVMHSGQMWQERSQVIRRLLVSTTKHKRWYIQSITVINDEGTV